MMEARKRSFPVVQQRMHDFPDEEPSGDIHHEESLVDEVSLQIDSLPNIPPNSSHEEDNIASETDAGDKTFSMENQLHVYLDSDGSDVASHHNLSQTTFIPSEYFEMSPISAKDTSSDEGTFYLQTPTGSSKIQDLTFP